MFKKLMLAALLFPLIALATPTQTITDAAKQGWLDGTVLAAHTYKIAILTNASTAGAGATNWASVSANAAACTGTCTGYATTGWTLATRSSGIASNHACMDFSTKTYSATSATITGRAAAIIDTTADIVLALFCLDGAGGCAADTISTNGTWSVTIPSNVLCVN